MARDRRAEKSGESRARSGNQRGPASGPQAGA